ncbi:secretory pathway protein [Zalerion maritima]|uniref:Secretory pathway protein n=1 Tax=Zalerion maritima TaxID=339359 RepID=A0AAD5WQR6_9PEZI|nr:secretory pathway protein [Zalerion maritima]
MRRSVFATIAATLAGRAFAHGSETPEVDEDANWMTKHMAGEHHITSFDHLSFFTLHDFNANGQWEVDELLRMYGLFDDSNSHVNPQQREALGQRLLDLLDLDGDGIVQREEWDQFVKDGKELPDLGTGPGHHGDDEYEYEIHHWEKYHNEDSPMEELNHPEDIEHFRKHEELEEQEMKQERMDAQAVVESNIPNKFRRPTKKQ